MILSFLRRLFGGAPAGPAPLLTIAVTLYRDRRRGGTLKVLDADARVVGGPWFAYGRADAARAASHGNPGLDPLRILGHTPFGGYVVEDFIQPDHHPGGVAAIGRCGALRLRGTEGDAARANGRNPILLHGGAGPETPTDGAIRVSDDAMAAILTLMPDHPHRLEQPVTVLVEALREDDGADLAWEREERERRERDHDRRQEQERQRESDRRSSGTSTSGAEPPPTDTSDNRGWWAPATVAGATAAAVATARDAEAAAGLAKAEVTMLPDGDAKPPALDAGPAGDAPAPTGAADTPASSDWSPSGGGYDR